MKAANYIIREAKVSDAGNIRRYNKLIYQTSDHLITKPNEFKTGILKQRFWIAGKIANPYETCLVAEGDEQIVGLVENWTDRRTRVQHVTTLAMSVHPDWRKRGIGSALLKDFLKWSQDNPHIQKVELHVHATNAAARRLYSRHGFETEGRRAKAIQHDKNRFVDDIMMAYWPNSSDVEKQE